MSRVSYPPRSVARRVYIVDPLDDADRITKAAAEMREMGHIPLSEYLDEDEYWAHDYDCILRLQGDSKAADWECYGARQSGKSVYSHLEDIPGPWE